MKTSPPTTTVRKHAGLRRARPHVAVLMVIAALLGWDAYQARVVATRRAELQAMQARLEHLRAANDALRSQNRRDAGQLAQASEELRQLPPPTTGAVAAAETERRAWLERVHTLRKLFDSRPDQRIPEMHWLTDADWLLVAKTASLARDDDIRIAMAALRLAAKNSFANVARDALQRAVVNGFDPTHRVSELAAYFTPPIDPAVLERYVLRGALDGLRIIGSVGPQVTLLEKTPVDPVYDSAIGINPNGTVTMSAGPVNWSPELRASMRRATDAYRATNPTDLDPPLQKVIAYAQPPLDQATIENLLKSEEAQKRKVR